jgi:aminopeptidase N
MRKFLITTLTLACLVQIHAQQTQTTPAWRNIYRATPTKVNALVHQKLDAKFDYNNSWLIGKTWITLKPHFYPTDSLTLDAKGMQINQVAIVKNGSNVPLKYMYNDKNNLYINLDRTYKANETYTIYIDYIAKPNDYQAVGSAAITDAKGLYFINPKGEEKDKPTQIWTQGETEATSVYIPTIDKTNQKTTQEFVLTVPSKYVTLSNGKLASQKTNGDGTRTDTWKMELPHAPYLFFIGVGDWAIVRDSYKGKEVNYYVEKEYAPVAKKIFGYTPEMMGFFSKLLGVEYPWVKYSQIVGRDYVSGAMENTTATLHQESAQQNARELVDGNDWEDVISHELFHQWFGDLVTTESWSNLTVNESFADYSEYLWREYKHGKDAAYDAAFTAMNNYLSRGTEASKDLVRFYYRDKEDMFDLVSYQKGGRILNMLRNYLGDSAFFKGLNVYLNENKFSSGEAHQLRLAMEKVSGRDLNWFFNQWYFGSGHPRLTITNSYDAGKQQNMMIVRQTQAGDKIFKLPVAVDVYSSAGKSRQNIWIENKTDTFYFNAASKPLLVNFDADKVILATKNDSLKTLDEYAYQFSHATNFIDRMQALNFASSRTSEAAAYKLFADALNDPYYKIRLAAIQKFGELTLTPAVLSKIESMAVNDPNRPVRATAIALLGQQKNAKYLDLFVRSTRDSSYSVAGRALTALVQLDPKRALQLVPELKKDAKGLLESAIENAEVLTKTDADFEEMYKDFTSGGLQKQFGNFQTFITYLSVINNTDNFKKGVDALVKFRNAVMNFVPAFKDTFAKQMQELKSKKTGDQAAYIDQALK